MDVKDLKLYQQIAVYIIPMIANLQVINTAVVFVRLHWFEKRFKDIGTFDVPGQYFFRRNWASEMLMSLTTQFICRVNRPRAECNRTLYSAIKMAIATRAMKLLNKVTRGLLRHQESIARATIRRFQGARVAATQP